MSGNRLMIFYKTDKVFAGQLKVKLTVKNMSDLRFVSTFSQSVKFL